MSSLKEKMAKGFAISLTEEEEATAASMRSTTPVTGPGQTMQITALRKQIEELKAELKKRDDAGGVSEARLKELEAQLLDASALDVEIYSLVEVPGRRRFMTEEKKLELRENIRHNGLVQPIVVRPLGNGKFEILSGHNRSDQVKALGQERIRAVLKEASDEEAEGAAFWANLLQSDLTDYEKYRGFKQMQERHPKITQAEMSEQSGISETVISYLLSFDDLPHEVLSILSEQPGLIGATAGKTLAGLAKGGRAAEVIAAVGQLAAGKIDQTQAVKLASAKPPKVAAPVDTVKIKRGKAVYCELRRAANVLRLQFKSDEEAKRVQAAIQKILEAESAVPASE
ncbi:ParB/RepB/Spo0J family partition protein [Paraburkholderia sp. CNPSo 3157]|uniref:ParB/RepB/Spo0J family partition protein n=1 Tax=Paraburkholderia franconis TaxID=2654983 RepID=A0A7X1NEH4_9BURK|nr:ParB/RepB/Spo0J family partition protein [Paraburkholderia franconis]MPW20056.1 ParB/RepB/Spo0J family partition protein [Paraburkholderia franconis]